MGRYKVSKRLGEADGPVPAQLKARFNAMKEQDNRRDSIFRQSVEAQKHASDLLEKKFQEALRKAKETPDTGRPLRDFDLD